MSMVFAAVLRVAGRLRGAGRAGGGREKLLINDRCAAPCRDGRPGVVYDTYK